MQRSFGISLTAVLCGLGGLLGLLFAMLSFGMLLLSPQALPPGSGVVPFVMVATLGFAFSGWAIATMVGLWRLKNSARWSVLVYAGLLVFMGISSGALMAVIPLPPTPNAPAETMEGMRIGLVGFYGVLAALGTVWLVYFNRGSVKAQFAGANPPPLPSPRPTSISVIAYLQLFVGVSALWSLFMPVPAIILGFAIHGLPGRLVFLSWCAGYAAVGYGLLRLRPWSRIGGIALFVFGIVNSLVSLPGFGARMEEVMRDLPGSQQASAQAIAMFANGWFAGLIVVFVVVTSAIPIWFLVKHRHAFEPPKAAVQA